MIELPYQRHPLVSGYVSQVESPATHHMSPDRFKLHTGRVVVKVVNFVVYRVVLRVGPWSSLR